jgi:hypothetical protein
MISSRRGLQTPKSILIHGNSTKTSFNNSIFWIDALLQNGITDHGKYVASLILIPYFVSIKSMSDIVSLFRCQ